MNESRTRSPPFWAKLPKVEVLCSSIFANSDRFIDPIVESNRSIAVDMASERDDDDRRYLPVVVLPNPVVFHQPSTTAALGASATAELMVAMQPGVDLPSLEVQEVVVVTAGRDRDYGSAGRSHHASYYYYEDDGGDEGQRGRGAAMDEDDYENGTESVAAEIEVVDARSFERFLVSHARTRGEQRFRAKTRRGRLKRKGRFTKKSPVKMTTMTSMSKRRTVESLPEFEDSESDAMEGYGASHKPRKRDFAHRHVI